MDADIESKVKNCQLCQQNQKSPPAVSMRNFAQEDTWLAGKIRNPPGPRSYNVKLCDERTVRCHADHIRPRSENLPEESTDNALDESKSPCKQHCSTNTPTTFNKNFMTIR